MTVLIDAVGHQHDCFASGNLRHSLEREINCVIEHCPISRRRDVKLGTTNRRDIGRFAKHVNLAIEGNRHHAIVEPQTADEGISGVADLRQFKLGRAAHVQHQRNCERFFDRSEVRNLLLDAVFVNAKVLLPQVGDVAAISIHHHRGHGDEAGVNANDTPFIDLVRTFICWLLRLSLTAGIDACRAEYWSCPGLLRRLSQSHDFHRHHQTG